MQLTSPQDISTKYRHIFLSPHLDDIVYSCGGTLGMQVSSGIHPLVISVFAGAPAQNIQLGSFATQVTRSWGSSSTGVHGLMETRRQEDRTALDYLQADYLWLDYQEAIFRGNPPYYASEEQIIGGDVHLEDSEIDRDFAALLLDLQARLPDTAWYAPLGVGRHVDHQIVSSAADRLLEHGAKVYFYEDFPYAARKENAVEERLNELGAEYEYALVEVSEMMPLRLEASTIYASQIASNFGSVEGMQKLIDTYAHNIRPVETVSLERYWTVR
jgi:LmbE family N-acetylglucosaminyl deacetylase